MLEAIGVIHAHDASVGPDNGYNGIIRITRTPASGQYINLTRMGNVVWSMGTVYNTNTFAIGNGTATDSSFTAPAFTINTSGCVGIGSASPAMTLDVTGSAHVSSTLQVDGVITASGAGTIRDAAGGWVRMGQQDGITRLMAAAGT